MLEKSKLLLVVGSGATRDVGMPGVTDVHNQFIAEALKNYSLYNDNTKSLYDEIFDKVDEYWKSQKLANYNKEANFEDILYIASLLTTYNPYIDISKLPEITYFGDKRTVDRQIVYSLCSNLVDHLLKDIRERCKILQSAKLKDLQNFLNILSEKFEISILTTNYDDIFYRASGALETGFDQTGSFDPKRLFQRNSWPCTLHLHGSVHFDMRIHKNDLHTIFWQEDLSQPFQSNSRGRSSKYSNEGITFPTSTIIAGFGKTAQILLPPFRTYYSEMERLVFDSDAVLFIGYGFGDNHINEAFAKYRDTRNRKVVIIDYADNNVMTAGSSFDSHRPIEKAMNIIATDMNDMACLGSKRPKRVQELKTAKEFDVSAEISRPLSVWYDGLQGLYGHEGKLMDQFSDA